MLYYCLVISLNIECFGKTVEPKFLILVVTNVFLFYLVGFLLSSTVMGHEDSCTESKCLTSLLFLLASYGNKMI